MKTLTSTLAALLICTFVFGQKISRNPKSAGDPFGYGNFLLVENGQKSFVISKYKTSNLEYLCFLQWRFRVYAHDYPLAYSEMLPDTAKYPDLFNPAKANEPVKGITFKQAQAFCQWRSDRMNEYILIREGILKKDFNQLNEECFTTESYLAFQYIGLEKNGMLDAKSHQSRSVIQQDFILLPSFYIASKEELKLCDSLVKLRPVKLKKLKYLDLDWWQRQEILNLKIEKSKTPLSYYLNKSKLMSSKDTSSFAYQFVKKNRKLLAKKTIDFNPNGVLTSKQDLRLSNIKNFKAQLRYSNSLCDSTINPFDIENKGSDKIEIKNEFGKMPFVYLGDLLDGSPVCMKDQDFNSSVNNDIAENGFFCAMNIPYRAQIEIQRHYVKHYGFLYRY